MKRLGFFVLTGLFLVVVVGMSQISRSESINACSNVENIIANHVPIPPYTVVSKTPIKGHNLCAVILKIKKLRAGGYNFVPVFVSKDFVIAGEMFKNHHQITLEKIRKLKNQEFSKTFKKYKPLLKKLVAATYKPANASKRYVYFISDPLCPYCNMAKKRIKDLADKYNFSVKVVFFPVHGKPAENKISTFVCGHKTYNNYLNSNFGSKTCKAGEKYISQSIKTGMKLGVNGTPTFITDNGNVVLGLNVRKIEKLMSNRR